MDHMDQRDLRMHQIYYPGDIIFNDEMVAEEVVSGSPESDTLEYIEVPLDSWTHPAIETDRHTQSRPDSLSELYQLPIDSLLDGDSIWHSLEQNTLFQQDTATDITLQHYTEEVIDEEGNTSYLNQPVLLDKTPPQLVMSSCGDVDLEDENFVDSGVDFIEEDHVMHITLQYRTSVVEDMWTTNTNGCRIDYPGAQTGQGSKISSNTQQPEMLPFPSCDQWLRPDIVKMAEKLLAHMDKGVVLECYKGDIYATRFCKCSVFYSNFEMKGQALKLRRGEKCKIFDFNGSYVEAYKQDANISPEVYLGFGQKWTFGSQPHGVIITAKVVSSKSFILECKKH